ncbi:MAG: hypothetical protein DRQ98_14390 [Gammaproteobacteria bacterium]|nr:MAG: hypothetical protein DRQ98_14390 [Gammaproteobacteria bacterium]
MKSFVTAFAVLVPGFGAGACTGGGAERSRPAGSAIWADSQSVEVTTSDLAALNRVGIGEVWVDAASIVFKGGLSMEIDGRFLLPDTRTLPIVIWRPFWVPFGPICGGIWQPSWLVSSGKRSYFR